VARILVDICHPAHAHFFRHPIAELQARGHEIIVTSRHKEMATDLLDDFQIEHRPLCTTARGGAFGMLSELVRRDLALARLVREIRPACMTAIGGIFVAHAGFLTRTPAVVFYDTENAKLQNLLTYPVATRVVAPRCYESWLPRNAIRYPGYHELSYLHPDRFTPDRNLALANGLATEGDTFLIRTVAWNANHDVGEQGWSPELLRQLVSHLRAIGTVLISSEAPLPSDLEPNRYMGDPSHIHHLMAFCRMYIGESATMASESAVLGVPAIYAATTGRGYTTEQENRFGLVRNETQPTLESVLRAFSEMLRDAPERYARKREQLLHDSVDVARFAADTLEGITEPDRQCASS
jgi:predicted glycosyltransferase